MITLNSYLGAHRAFPDVQAMEAVMTHPSLVSCLTNLPIRSPKETDRAVVNTESCASAVGFPCEGLGEANYQQSTGKETRRTWTGDCYFEDP